MGGGRPRVDKRVAPEPQHLGHLLELPLQRQLGNQQAIGAKDTAEHAGLAVDGRSMGIDVLPPDVNDGNYRFEPVDEKRIRYGLGGIKGTGQSAIEAIVRARPAGPFVDLFDFCRRVDKRLAGLFRLLHAAEDFGDLCILDHFRQAVCAKQDSIAVQ